MASMSPASTASAKLPTTSRSRPAFGSGARSRPAAGRRDSNAARARRSRLLTEVGGGIEHLGDLLGAEAEHVAQHEHRSLLRREVLEADDERQGDRLLGLVARLGSGGFVRDAIEQRIGVGLEPDRLGPARGLGHLGHAAASLPGGGGSHGGHPASDSWRSGTARHGPTRVARTARARATRRAASPGAGPRRPARSRRSGRCAAGAHAGRGRSARGTRPRRRRAHGPRSARSRSHPLTGSSFRRHLQ